MGCYADTAAAPTKPTAPWTSLVSGMTLLIMHATMLEVSYCLIGILFIRYSEEPMPYLEFSSLNIQYKHSN